MFKKRDAPELYELLNKNKMPMGKYPAKESTDTNAGEKGQRARTADASADNTHSAVESSSATPAYPGSIPELTSPRPYHKLRSPFPAKPERTQRPSVADIRFSAKTPSKRTSALQRNYTPLVIGIAVLVVAILIIYAVSPRSHNEAVTAPVGIDTNTDIHTLSTPPPPAKPVKFWTIEVIAYEDNAVGQTSLEKMKRSLDNLNIIGIFIRKERIKGEPHLVIYQGKYSSKEEASKGLLKYKNVHYVFRKTASLKELEEKK